MKHSKSILMAALAALSMVSAQADTIYISGSTAFRSAANNSISAVPGATLLASDNSTLGSAGNAIWSVGTNYVIAHWSGSELGIQSAAGPATGTNTKTIPFCSLANTNLGIGNSALTATATNPQVASIAFSDTYQSTSIFNGKVVDSSGNSTTYTSLPDSVVGVVSFTWVGSKNFPTNANVTTPVAQNLMSAPVMPVTMFTGVPSDYTNAVYLIGRNKDSGTRLQTLVNIGLKTSAGVHQYSVSSTSAIVDYPAETIDGIAAGTAQSGYSSGGTLCGYMTNVYTFGTGFTINGSASPQYTGTNFLIGYAGTSDANSKVSGGLVELPYNGVNVSQTAIENGNYGFWGYEHVLVGNSATTAGTAFAATLVSTIQGLASSDAKLFPNVALTDMYVTRSVDGSSLSPFFY